VDSINLSQIFLFSTKTSNLFIAQFLVFSSLHMSYNFANYTQRYKFSPVCHSGLDPVSSTGQAPESSVFLNFHFHGNDLPCFHEFRHANRNDLENRIVKKEMGEGDYASHDPDSCPAA
jgi:hypothetical protein